MSPIRKIGDTWYSDIYVNGKRVRKKLSSNKNTAQKIYNQLVSSNQLAAFGIIQEGYPLDRLKNDFLQEIKPHILPKTYHDSETILNNAFEQMQGVQLATLRSLLNGYINSRIQAGKSAKILNRTIGLFKRVIAYGIQTKVITFDPIADIKYFKERRPARRVLTHEEITSLLNHSGKYKIIWLTFLSTGVRLSELISLTWGDVNLAKGMISVRRSKTDAGVREIPISPGLMVELKKMVDREGYVFKTKIGTQYKNNLLRRFKECIAKAGIDPDGLNLHSLRHTFATILASNNTHPKHIQALLGHKSAITSLDIYTKVYTEDLKRIIQNVKVC